MKPGGHKLVRNVLGCMIVLALLAAGCDRIHALWRTDRCVLSDRVIHAKMAVRVAVEGGVHGRACCFRCAITYTHQTGKRVRILSVTDYDTGKALRPEDAIYVADSDVVMCAGPPAETSSGRRECVIRGWDRCAPSIIAFAKPDRARAFQQAHGGRIKTFAEVVKGSNVE